MAAICTYPVPGEACKCPAPTTTRPPCAGIRPEERSGSCFAFWWVQGRTEPVKLKLHRWDCGHRVVKFGDKPSGGGHWLLGNGGHENDVNVFEVSLKVGDDLRQADFRFEQIKASSMYRLVFSRGAEKDIFLVHLPEESS